MAIYELYANALRYGTGRDEVRLELRRTEQAVVLTVSNSAEPEQIERLKAQLASVSRDPSAAFSGEMSRFDGGAQAPMLGIVRIAHEVGLALELHGDEQRVEVSTRCSA